MRRNIIAIIVRPASLRFSLVPPRRSRTLRNHNPNGGGSMRSEGRQGSMLRFDELANKKRFASSLTASVASAKERR